MSLKFIGVIMTTKKLDQIAEIFTGARTSRYINENNSLKPVIKNKFSQDKIHLEFSNEPISNKLDEKFYSRKGDIVISLSAPNNVSLIDKDDYIIPMQFAVIRLHDGYDPNFITAALKSSYFSNEISRRLEGTSLKIIKIEYLKEMELNIPDYEKQKSIGEYFNLMNQRNMLLERKIELNKEFENKVMADILKSR